SLKLFHSSSFLTTYFVVLYKLPTVEYLITSSNPQATTASHEPIVPSTTPRSRASYVSFIGIDTGVAPRASSHSLASGDGERIRIPFKSSKLSTGLETVCK